MLAFWLATSSKHTNARKGITCPSKLNERVLPVIVFVSFFATNPQTICMGWITAILLAASLPWASTETRSVAVEMTETSNVATPTVKSMRRARRVERILAAFAKRDLEALRELAQAPGGFILDSVRKLVWYAWPYSFYALLSDLFLLSSQAGFVTHASWLLRKREREWYVRHVLSLTIFNQLITWKQKRI